jgi:hypothetical protein
MTSTSTQELAPSSTRGVVRSARATGIESASKPHCEQGSGQARYLTLLTSHRSQTL